MNKLMKRTMTIASVLMLALLASACERDSVVTVSGGEVEGDPFSESGATISGQSTLTFTNIATVSDVSEPEQGSSIFLRARRGAGITFDCVCKAGGTDLNCEENCEIDIPGGTANCTCNALGCQNCAADLGIVGTNVSFVVADRKVIAEARTDDGRHCIPKLPVTNDSHVVANASLP